MVLELTNSYTTLSQKCFIWSPSFKKIKAEEINAEPSKNFILQEVLGEISLPVWPRGSSRGHILCRAQQCCIDTGG